MEEIKEGYLRVTTPLQKYSNYGSIDPIVLSNAALRGTKVHKLCELSMLGQWFPQPEKSLRGYMDSFYYFQEMMEEIIHTEIRLYNDIYMLTGCIDIVAVIKGDKSPCIIDIKTPATESLTWALQLSAYRYLYNSSDGLGEKAVRRLALCLKKDGSKPRLYEYTQHGLDWDLYLSALKLHRRFGGE